MWSPWHLLMHHQAYNSLWDCSARGGNSYSYCVSRAQCQPCMNICILKFSLLLMNLLDNQGTQAAYVDGRIHHLSSQAKTQNKQNQVLRNYVVPLWEQASTTTEPNQLIQAKQKTYSSPLRATSLHKIRGQNRRFHHESSRGRERNHAGKSRVCLRNNWSHQRRGGHNSGYQLPRWLQFRHRNTREYRADSELRRYLRRDTGGWVFVLWWREVPDLKGLDEWSSFWLCGVDERICEISME